MSSALTFPVDPSVVRTPAAERNKILTSPGFGRHFTDHMAAATWTAGRGWHDSAVTAYAPITLSPSSGVLHYGQEIFEGLKAYRHPDGSIWAFRPQLNADRFSKSADRIILPRLPAGDFLAAIRQLVTADQDWVGHGDNDALYIRPFMFSDDELLSSHPADRVRFYVIASPVASYFTGSASVAIWVCTDYVRAAPGGTGAAKCGGNYSSGMAAQRQAKDHGCQQVCFLDAADRKWIEELGGMNLFFVIDGHQLVTPQLTGTILDGVTRRSLLTIAQDLGYEVTERRISLEECQAGIASGRISEMFACGTAAVVTSIGRLAWDDGDAIVGDGAQGKATGQLRSALIDLQRGRAEDKHAWLYRLV